MVRVNLDSRKSFDFLTKGQTKLLRLAVAGANGTPHVSSVWYLWKDDYFYISTSEERLKVRTVRDNPRVALVIDTDQLPYEGVIVEGTAKLTKKNVREITLAIVKKYVPVKDVRAQFDELMHYPRILIKIKPRKAIDIMSYKAL